ncbi:hypothetical protein [Bartonella sp. MM73XJBT]|uniref:hypothetical protein n=1 Tax=Bartonella sp. MM73XJBT TaxID=3019095 RepID=UPI00235F9B9B|nr:hypothetical protein [Bartonella sp. MM73XJBT]
MWYEKTKNASYESSQVARTVAALGADKINDGADLLLHKRKVVVLNGFTVIPPTSGAVTRNHYAHTLMDDNQTFSPMSEKTLYRFLHAFYFHLPVQNRLFPAPQRILSKHTSNSKTNEKYPSPKKGLKHPSPINMRIDSHNSAKHSVLKQKED